MILFSRTEGDLFAHHSIDASPDEADFPLHAHRFCEVYYFISGNGFYTVEGREYPLTSGCVLLMREGETHKLHIRADVPYERIAVHFPLDDVLPPTGAFAPLRALFLAHEPGENNRYAPATDEARDFVAACFARICRTPADGADFRPRLVGNLLAALCELRAEKSAPPSSPRAAREEVTVAEIIDYINTHLTEITGPAELGQRFFFSRSTLERLFRRSTGSTVWEFVTLKRLLAARAAIRAGRPAAIAAAACGFGDYSVFYRQYRRVFGESPCRERKTRKNREKA